jgi:DNA-binding transcriptional MerR regulator
MRLDDLNNPANPRPRRRRAQVPLVQTARISDLKKELGVTARTLRYWEGVGLLTAGRTSGRDRRYDVEQAERARFICELRGFGMPVREVKRLLEKGLRTRENRRELVDFLRARAVASEAEAKRLRRAIAEYEMT